VIAFGRAAIVEDDAEKRTALQRIAEKYAPDFEGEAVPYIEKYWKTTCVIRFNIEHITGKADKRHSV
jgi:nitroimidazol reductase NimA-like FMN-containing flavoprotein (pyridoxamine 5'-phosphate oxidase superfamily)